MAILIASFTATFIIPVMLGFSQNELCELVKSNFPENIAVAKTGRIALEEEGFYVISAFCVWPNEETLESIAFYIKRLCPLLPETKITAVATNTAGKKLTVTTLGGLYLFDYFGGKDETDFLDI